MPPHLAGCQETLWQRYCACLFCQVVYCVCKLLSSQYTTGWSNFCVVEVSGGLPRLKFTNLVSVKLRVACTCRLLNAGLV